jgi:hypothetical protein
VSVLVGHAADAGLMVRPAIRGSRWRSWSDVAGAARGEGVADGGRAVAKGCCERLACGGRAVGWRGLIWCTRGLPAVMSGRWGLLVVAGPAATLSHSCHKPRGTWWDARRHGETISAGRWEGRDKLGQVKTV